MVRAPTGTCSVALTPLADCLGPFAKDFLFFSVANSAVRSAGRGKCAFLEGSSLQEILDLSPEAGEELIERLTRHAKFKMAQLRWRGAFIAQGGSAPRGTEPGDLVLESIKRALEGKRKWNHSAYSTLGGFLCSVIDSLVSELVQSTDNRTVRRLPAGSSETLAVPDTTITLEIDIPWQQRFHEAAVKQLNGEPFLLKLLDCMEADITKPSEIAEMLGVPVATVNNEKKRLKNWLAKLDTRIPRSKGRTGL